MKKVANVIIVKWKRAFSHVKVFIIYTIWIVFMKTKFKTNGFFLGNLNSMKKKNGYLNLVNIYKIDQKHFS